MNILVSIPSGYDRDTFIPKEVADELSILGNVHWNTSSRQWNAKELQEQLVDIDICITGWGSVRFDHEVLQGANRLKLVAHMGGTVAPIISPEFYQRGIRIISGNDVFARSVAEGVVAYMLLAQRRIAAYMEKMRVQGWAEADYWTEGLLDQTVGLVGFGAIASYMIPLLKVFNVTIKVYSSHLSKEAADKLGVQKASLEEIMTTCKIVSLHSANTPQNYHLINRNLLLQMQPGALLVNTARGELLDENALVEVCQSKGIRALLDVYKEEDHLPKDSPLWNCPEIMLIPHMAGPTVDQRKVVGMHLAKEIQAYLNGKPLTMEIEKDTAARMSVK